VKSSNINDITVETPLFIGGWYIDKSLCDKLINYFEQHPDKAAGRIGSKGLIDRTKKASTDIQINLPVQSKLLKTYFLELQKVCEEYKKMYPECDKGHGAWGAFHFNIQKYLPNEAYFLAHSDRMSKLFESRVLVFSTYLNDIKEGGETEFIYQKLKVKPEKGLTIIFPVDWTHTHRGIPAPKETKYLLTGWYNYI
jgi:prolyl 4-hydroxylase